MVDRFNSNEEPEESPVKIAKEIVYSPDYDNRQKAVILISEAIQQGWEKGYDEGVKEFDELNPNESEKTEKNKLDLSCLWHFTSMPEFQTHICDRRWNAAHEAGWRMCLRKMEDLGLITMNDIDRSPQPKDLEEMKKYESLIKELNGD